MIRVALPTHLRALARIDGEVHLDIEEEQRQVLRLLRALPDGRRTVTATEHLHVIIARAE
jgi:hypothetical protein